MANNLMATKTANFNQFEVGDYTVFSRTFTFEEFAAFSALSGDTNQLHHDSAFAATTEFQKPIVPLHMVMAPLSRIAGMIFPGRPSLYLGHDAKAILPVFYDEEITYSARLAAINHSHRVLSIEVLAFRGSEIVLTSTMKVQAREETWDEPEEISRLSTTQNRTALITGASGAIGSAISLDLARRGYRLLLHGSSNDAALAGLADECQSYGADVDTLLCPLENEPSANELAQWCVSQDIPDLVIHSACPPLHSDLNLLVSINYTALRILVDAITPHFLKRQSGSVVFVSSSAVESHPDGWEDYVAAKSMAASYISGFDQRYSQYGPRGIVVAPSYVKSSFSSGLFADSVPAMLPEEVAEKIADCLFGPLKGKPYYVVSRNGLVAGSHGFRVSNAPQLRSASASESTSIADQKVENETPAASQRDGLSEKLNRVMRQILKITPEDDIEEAGLGVTPGWDSLRHIEILLVLESEFAVSFTTDEINQAQDYCGIRDLLRAALE